jgi:hypothetical protein
MSHTMIKGSARMTARLAGLAEKTRDLHARLKKFFDTPLDAASTPLEIRHAILDDVERRVEPIGRGLRVFPYTRLSIRIKQVQPDRAPLESALEGLEADIRERLREVRCEPPRVLEVRVVYLRKSPPEWRPDQMFAVDCAREAQVQAPVAPAAASAPVPSLRVTVLKGAATETRYTFTDPVVSIGRSEDPTDALGRVRRNRVAFVDTVDGVTETVGRAHARLRFDQEAHEFRLFDDGSSNGTSIIRGGSTIAVQPRDPRGVRIQSGDEIQVGRAVLRVTVGAQ